MRHPAKYPETLAKEFIEFFTRGGQTILDPMVGTGSSLVAALRSGRNSFGIELNADYAGIASQVVAEEVAHLGEAAAGLTAQVILGNAEKIAEYVETYQIPPIDYVITSPPYWNMLRARASKPKKNTAIHPIWMYSTPTIRMTWEISTIIKYSCSVWRVFMLRSSHSSATEPI